MKTMSQLVIAAMAVMTLTVCNSNTVQEKDSKPTTNAALENIMTRTSIRSYTQQTIPTDTIELLLKAGIKQAQDKYQRLMNNKSPKNKRK